MRRRYLATLIVAAMAGGFGIGLTLPGGATLKDPVRGLLDRHHAPPAGYRDAIHSFVVNVDWADVEPAAGAFDYSAIDADLSVAGRLGERVKLRVAAGVGSPGWATTLDGPAVTIYDHAGAARALPRFWTAAFDAAYRELQRHLARRYDADAAVGQVVSTECAMLFSEPYLRDTSDPRNVANLLAAGFTRAADDACHLREMHATGDYWSQTRSEIAFNPYQAIGPDGSVHPDEAYTEAQMAAFRSLLGRRAVLANYSISSTRPSVPRYGAMYAAQKAAGPPIAYQTATADKIGDWRSTLLWATSQGANSVELPSGYTNWPAGELADLAAGLAANPVDGGPAPTPSATSASPSPSGSASPSPSPGGGVDKVLVVMEENEPRSSALAGMPYLASLATTYGQATDYSAVTHPSLPNYLAIAGGSTFGIADDNPPSAHPISGASVFGQALDAGATARTYAEDMPGPCALSSSGDYAVKHNPWAYFTDERTACRAFDLPAGTVSAGALRRDTDAGTLPNLGMVVPNLCNDAHNCPLSTADDWLRGWVPVLMDGPDYRAGRLAIVVTFDEGQAGSQVVAWVAASPALSHVASATPYSHYSFSRTLSEVVGAPPLRDAATAASMAAAFKL